MKTARLLASLSLAVLMGLVGPTWAHEITLVARLTGEAEVPGPGDPDGRGKATIRLNDEKGKVCFRIRYEGIGQPTGGHIHAARKGQSGDVVVSLFDQGGPSPITGCERGVASDLIKSIQRNPARFYVNIHNEEFAAGALRGQLRIRR